MCSRLWLLPAMLETSGAMLMSRVKLNRRYMMRKADCYVIKIKHDLLVNLHLLVKLENYQNGCNSNCIKSQ